MPASDVVPAEGPGDGGSGLSRRAFLVAGAVTAAVAGVPSGSPAQAAAASGAHRQTTQFVYVGTYTAPGVAPDGTRPSTAVGIYVFGLDPRTGDLVPLPDATSAVSNPSFLAVHPTLPTLYAVHEDPAGQVSAFGIDPTTGGLELINSAPTEGEHPTHLSVDPSGRFLLAANYSSGSFPVFRLRADGGIERMTDLFRGSGNGTGPDPDRQEGPHAHQLISRSDGDVTRVFGVDLGADRVYVLTLDHATGRLTPSTVPFANVASGAGPRHLAFHPGLDVAYVLDELVSTITAFVYDPARGSFAWLQTISTLPDRYRDPNKAAEIRVHPGGRFLYSTNRGHDSITMYRIGSRSGMLEVIGWESTRGQWPRGMNLDPSGTFLYAANQNSDSIAVFRISRSTGQLRPRGLVRTPTPVDIQFGPAGRAGTGRPADATSRG